MKVFFCVLFCVFVLNVSAQERENFVLVKKDGTIAIYERWITFPKSDPPIKAREVKSEFTFRNTVDAAVRLLQDESRIQAWQSHVSHFEVFPLADSSQWFEYSYHDIPWPVSDQDHFLIYKFLRRTTSNVFIEFESRHDPSMAPMKKGVTRMTLSGSWTFEKVNQDEVKATYRILSSPLNIPKFLTDPIIRNNMMTTIKEFIAIMETSAKK